ncbi:HET-domain-containing protein [Colletotrichum zoysiae]|uniref:HET-domain-containing protein n=1 Tax=Colletotrichum zoysiae TaxID=1216348 RepID=A0AAD9LXR3_9PEZI|nr:HET-domain-containing protein [Colletotrichum zoysiae]
MIGFLRRQVTEIRAQGPRDFVDVEHPVYRRLPVRPDEIRILKLQPGRSVSSPIEVYLSVARLGDQSVPYDALSYRWGDSNDKVTIRVNGESLEVTRSLATALRHLRQLNREVTLWADSICINQGNDSEKNLQVALMGDIYRTADCVRIWLGTGSNYTEEAMQLVNDCNVFPDGSVVVQRIVSDERGATGLAELLRRPYWNRMWMFQEILLAKLAHVHCDTFDAPFDAFVYMDVLSSRAHLWPDRRTSPRWIFDLRRAFFNIAQFTIAPAELGNLEDVLLATRVLQASDPRDKLFALMGTCDMASYLTIDYQTPFRDVYVEFTKNHSRLTGKLSLVLTAGWRNPESEDGAGQLPSWTPDYRSPRPESDIYAGFAAAGIFDASKGRHFADESPEEYLPVGALRTRGFILDTIESAVPLLGGDDGRSQVLGAFDLQRPRRQDDPSGKSQLQALCETIIFDADGVKENDGEEARAHKKDRKRKHLLGFMHDLALRHGRFSAKGAGIPFSWDTFLGYPRTGDLESTVRCYEQLGGSEPGALDEYRAMFVKEYNANAGKISSAFATRGNIFGRSNCTIRPGDVVAVLHGSDLPVVLRRDGPCYKFIGGAYVGGIMYGEVMDDVAIASRAESILLI